MAARKWIVSHRGDHTEAAENTLGAFRDAIMAGADMVEFDVRRLADGVLVVAHDAQISGVPLNDLDYRAAREANSGQLATLAQALELCVNRIGVDIELKEPHCEEDVLRALYKVRYRMSEYIVTSFHHHSLQLLRDACPGMCTGLLTEGRVQEALPDFERVEADYLLPYIEPLDAESLALSARLGLRLIPWTVNRREDLRRLLAEACVTGIITDRTRLALGLRRAFSVAVE
jgi:glycerophosphoryl diester phosphodiesterase